MMEISLVKWAPDKHYLNYYLHIGFMAHATLVAISGTIVLLPYPIDHVAATNSGDGC